jgi:hypothetical protein
MSAMSYYSTDHGQLDKNLCSLIKRPKQVLVHVRGQKIYVSGVFFCTNPSVVGKPRRQRVWEHGGYCGSSTATIPGRRKRDPGDVSQGQLGKIRRSQPWRLSHPRATSRPIPIPG